MFCICIRVQVRVRVCICLSFFLFFFVNLLNGWMNGWKCVKEGFIWRGGGVCRVCRVRWLIVSLEERKSDIYIYPVILLLLPAGGVIYLYTYFEFGAECTSVGLYSMCM